jgi:tRNA (guanine-N7-)-methyltransferase
LPRPRPVTQDRLPLTHPDYRYPGSWNPYWKKLKELGDVVRHDNGTEAHPGHWRAQFADPAFQGAPLHLEIGCNAGHVILEWAARDPKGAYIGLDWKFKMIFKGAEKARKRELKNLLFFRAHADRLRYMFAPGEVDHLYLYFPDPWPKKAHWKNRFVTAANLNELAGIVRKNGSFHIKTDHPGYFEWMERALSQVSDLWEIQARTTDLHADHPDPGRLEIPEVTLFERLFIKKSIPIHSLQLRRK